MGFSKSGKTTAIESVIRYLKSLNYNVATIKHIHIENFSIDTPGKNTWRMAESGADPVVSLSANETAFITKQHLSLDSMVKICKIINKERINKKSELDFIFVEGIWDNSYYKIINLKSPAEFDEHLNNILKKPNFNEILETVICYSGAIKSEEKLCTHINKSINNADLDENIKNHLNQIPFINIKDYPEAFLAVYNKSMEK